MGLEDEENIKFGKEFLEALSPGKYQDVKLLGDFYTIVKGLGQTTKDVTGWRNWFPGDAGYTTNFLHNDLSVKIYEWRHSLALNDYLNEIWIRENNLLTYNANVHRDNLSHHLVKVRSLNPRWIIRVFDILEGYF